MTKPWESISIDDQITEVQRELALRGRVYPQWIKRGDLSPSVALHRQHRLQAVLGTLQKLKASLAKGDG